MKRGDHVGEFTALDENGDEVRLSDLLTSGPVVLFFYPKARTPL
jgi:peroxiredoxin Q/BCP